MKTRNIQIDALKYLLVTFVIFDHLLLIHGFVNKGLDIIIDSTTQNLSIAFGAFVIPIFVFMSGIFCKKGLALGEQIRKSFPILKIFFIFQILDLLIQYFVDGKSLSINTLFVPQFALWYLLSLFTWRIMLCFISVFLFLCLELVMENKF